MQVRYWTIVLGAWLWSASIQAQVSAEDDQRAHRAFESGRDAYETGHFAEAVISYARAYDLSHLPKFLYNIGRAADQDHQFARALEAYERYLEAVPQAENRLFVEGRIRKLRETLTAPAPVVVEQPQPTPVSAVHSQPTPTVAPPVQKQHEARMRALTLERSDWTNRTTNSAGPYVLMAGGGPLLVLAILLWINGGDALPPALMGTAGASLIVGGVVAKVLETSEEERGANIQRINQQLDELRAHPEATPPSRGATMRWRVSF